MEPERPIESLLRGYAKKRREEAGAPLELHAATRRLLQGEVARRRANPRPPRPFAKVLAALWPRIAAAIGLFAALAFVVSVWLPGRNRTKEQFDLAKNEQAPKAAPSNEPRPVADALPAIAPADNLASTADLGVAYADRAERQRDKDVISSGAAHPGVAGGAEKPAEMRMQSSQSDAVKRSDEKEVALNQPALSPSVAQKTLSAPKYEPGPGQSVASARRMAPPPAAASPPLSAAENDSRRGLSSAKASSTNTSEESQSATVQRFTRVEPGTETATLFKSASAAQPVLAAFQVEQRGQEVRVVDSDGSVYMGYLQQNETEARKRTLDTENAAASRAFRLRAPSASSPSGNLETNHVFRVAGTNRTLNQKVVFTATLLQAAVGSRLDGTTNQVSGFGAPLKNSLSDSGALPLSNLSISGKVLIGDRPEIEIRAVPAAAP